MSPDKLQPLSPADVEKGSRMRSIILISITLIVLVAAVYLQAGNHEFLNFDDDVYVTANPHVASGLTGGNIIWAFTAFDRSNWHPVTWLSHMADAQLYGMSPRGHHLTNVVIHAISTVILFLLLFRVTGSRWQSSFVAALFALHPLHVESVAWVAERKDVLSAFFWFLTLLLYSEYATRQKRLFYILTLFSFMLGLMSKPMLVTLPLVMLMMDYWPLGRFRNGEGGEGLTQPSGRGSVLMVLVKEKIPFFACSLLSSVATIIAQHSGGAIQRLDEIPFLLRIENALIAYVTYIGKTLWPHDLAILYPIPLSLPPWQAICSLLVLLLVSAVTIRARHRYPYLAAGWFWFLVTLVPVIGIIQVGVQSMADRYSYIPLTGLFIMAAWGVPDLAKGLKQRQGILALLAGAVIIASAALTWQQLGYWRDNISLYRHTLQVTDGNYVIHNNLGSALANKWDLDAAILEFNEALRINPDYSDAHYNLGMAFAMKGSLDAAIRELREALRINPNNAKASYNLGVALDQKRQLLEIKK
ncbi:MAG TPA: tetratricopeptide repeat protein [Dongiaceae bacterium]|nr:tetratricopeptide repeat protein [Dongiaceae bacterium]